MAQQTLDAVRAPWNATLRKLTGASFDKGVDWQRWWNDNKRRNWDAKR